MQTSLSDGYNWEIKSYDLSALSAINDQASVTLRLSKFDDTGNDKLVFDNIELIGTMIIEIPGIPYIYIDTSKITDFLNMNSKNFGTTNGAISDPTDPAFTKGIYFLLRDSDTPTNTLTITTNSSNTTVVPNANLTLTTINDSIIKLNINPISDGYTDITVTVGDGANSTNYSINYASSLASYDILNTNYHFGTADASTAIDVGDNHIIIADDETNFLSLYQKDSSGYSLNQFDMGTPIGLVKEGDFEASFKKNSRAYWIGSLGNSKSGNIRPDRHEFFATDIIGSGKNTSLNYVGNYTIQADVIAWGDANGYDFTSSAASGQAPKLIDGFNVEGMALGPDQTSFYIGFRAPLVPRTGPNARTKALICPVENFESWFNNGSPIGSPTFGSPIELDLAGRSIRSIERNDDGEYLIVAGDYASGNVTFALYEWGGKSTDVPVLLTADLTGLNIEGIANVPTPLVDGSIVELVSDDGTRVWCGDGIAAKSLVDAN